MSTQIEMLELKIRHCKAALEARKAEAQALAIEMETRERMARAREAKSAAHAVATEVLEDELEAMEESLAKLQHTSDDIRGLIEEVFSQNPSTKTEDYLTPEPTDEIGAIDVLKMAVEGNDNSNHAADPFANGNITAEEAVKLALISMKQTLGPEGLVKMMIKAAVGTSQLSAEEVIKTTLKTARVSNIFVSDVVQAALAAALGSRHMSVKDIITPAVDTAVDSRFEPILIAKEAFVTAMRCDPARLETAVLTVLGCAVGMGLDSKAIKSILGIFAKETADDEMDLGAGASADAGDDADTTSLSQVAAPSLPPSISHMPFSVELKQEQSASNNNVKPPATTATSQAASSTVGTDRARELPVTIPHQLIVEAPRQYPAATQAPETIVQADNTQGHSGKRSATVDAQDETEARASKIVKMT
ncbi:hypothetical protein Daus18300_005495 [Diaporthe australafricana]|uniref:Uncharacterized protein n=1 Tax=Diaporthe australafricana TaxID=127596 RepID=A0ABR3X1U4_9PEZI